MPEMKIEGRSGLDRGPQVGHAAAGMIVVAVDGDGGIHADIQLNVLAIKELAAQTIAISFEKVAAIYEVGDWNRIKVRLIRAPIVRE